MVKVMVSIASSQRRRPEQGSKVTKDGRSLFLKCRAVMAVQNRFDAVLGGVSCAISGGELAICGIMRMCYKQRVWSRVIVSSCQRARGDNDVSSHTTYDVATSSVDSG